MAGFAIFMTIAIVGLVSLVAAGIMSACLYFATKRKEAVRGRRVVFVSSVAPFLALFWVGVALVIYVMVSNLLAHQSCGFSPDPYVTLPNGYVIGSHNTYDGYFHAPGVETDVPVVGPGYVRSLIDLDFSDPYFSGTQFDFQTSTTRSFVFDTRTRSFKATEPANEGGKPCGTPPDQACLSAWTDANTHAQTDTNSYLLDGLRAVSASLAKLCPPLPDSRG
ncbi:MAG TPA: hypothetical protein VHU89_00645 [Acidobacteriaceae bacterium]|jgi:hypothetical protein|nr:hypothetical protein [Acidobacteriaceae bacterium]